MLTFFAPPSRAYALGAVALSLAAACANNGPAAVPAAGGPGNGGMPGAADGLDHYTCQYVNPFNAAAQCKEYALTPGDQAAVTAAQTDCAANPIGRTIDLGEPGTFAQGSCDPTGSVGFCTMPDGSKDYVFDADCSAELPSARWGCEEQAGGSWTCTADDALSGGPSPTCRYVNPFNNVEQCKQYKVAPDDGDALNAAQADCQQNPIGRTIDLGEPGTFSMSDRCESATAIGYCLAADGSADFVYTGDCSDEAPSAKWGCEQQAEGSWVCLDGEPMFDGDKYTCIYANPFNAIDQCKEYTLPPGDAQALSAAQADCMQNPIGRTIDLGEPGTFATGSCDRADAIGYCLGDDRSLDFVYTGDCSPDAPSARWGCEEQAEGVWRCLIDDAGNGTGETPPPRDQYRCEFEETGSALGPDYALCREYGYSRTEQSARADCEGLGGTFSIGSCDRADVVGYCPVGSGEVNDLAYSPGRCDQAFGNVALQDRCGGDRVCGEAPPAPDPDAPVCDLGQSPTYTCNFTNAFSNDAACREFKDCSEELARELCETDGVSAAADPGSLSTSPCDTDAVGRCDLPDGAVEYLYGGDCSSGALSNQWGCEDQGGGTFTCLM